MEFFVRKALAVQIFILALAFSWIHGGTRPDLLFPVIPWLSLFVLSMLMVFPQARRSETLPEAQLRVWRSFFRDPLLYLAIIQLVLLVIPLFNVAGVPSVDPSTGQWVNPKPPFPSLPFCCNLGEHASLLLWFPPVMIATLAVRHGLLKRGKRILLELLCWNGAALALFGFLQRATGATSVFWGKEIFGTFFSTFGYPNIAGALFTLLFALSMGLWFTEIFKSMIGPTVEEVDPLAEEEVSGYRKNRMAIPALLCFAASLATYSRAAILLTLGLLLFLGGYMLIGCWQKSLPAQRIKIGLSSLAALFVVVMGVTVLAPDDMKREISTLSMEAITDRLSGRAQYHARVAGDIFKDYPVFGVGGWGYPHYQLQYMTPEEIKGAQIVGGINVHNDSLQFLAEQGSVGFALILATLLAVVLPMVKVIAGQAREAKLTARAVPSPSWIYTQPPVTVAAFAGCAATVVHSFGDLPFRDPAVLLTWFLAFACLPGFTPKVRVKRRILQEKQVREPGEKQ